MVYNICVLVFFCQVSVLNSTIGDDSWVKFTEVRKVKNGMKNEERTPHQLLLTNWRVFLYALGREFSWTPEPLTRVAVARGVCSRKI